MEKNTVKVRIPKALYESIKEKRAIKEAEMLNEDISHMLLDLGKWAVENYPSIAEKLADTSLKVGSDSYFKSIGTMLAGGGAGVAIPALATIAASAKKIAGKVKGAFGGKKPVTPGNEVAE